MQLTRVSLEEALEIIRPMARVLCDQHSNQITFVSLPAEARADAVRVRQVLLNLISNAAKFTEQGTIEVRIVPGEQAHRIVVRDTGRGMDPEQLAQAFEPFVQVHTSDHEQLDGTGLGLALSRDLATAMGGDLHATSALNKGVVEFVLPAFKA